MGEGVN